MFDPPVSTPTARTTAAAASRSSWYASSGSVICGATVTESPVCTPIGSRFSIEQTITTLSTWSRTTSSSNSSQPRTDSSTSTWPIGLSRRPISTWRRSSSGVVAKPPPWPPSVNAGRTTAGSAIASTSSRSVTMRDVGTFRSAGLDRLLEQLPVLGALDHLEVRADQLDAELGEDPRLGQLAREVERRLAAHRRQHRVAAARGAARRRRLRGRAARDTSGRRSRGRS